MALMVFFPPSFTNKFGQMDQSRPLGEVREDALIIIEIPLSDAISW